MGFYGLDHPNPNASQIGNPRRGGNKPSGTIVIHTAESHADLSGADMSAEGVAGYISRRTNYGSYHRIVDSDSIVAYAPFGMEAWHCQYTNPWSIGISFAVQAHKWPDYPDAFVDKILANGARAAAEAVRDLKRYWGVDVPLRRLTRAEALDKKPGFIGHGETDPWRRSDPGAKFPWARFFRLIEAELGREDTGASRDRDRQPAPAPAPKPEQKGVDVDGKWGSELTTALQRDVDAPVVDGEVSRQNRRWKRRNPGLTLKWQWFWRRSKYRKGSPFIKKMQRLLNRLGFDVGPVDGLIGPRFNKGLQRWLQSLGLYSGPIDGRFDYPSRSLKGLQEAHNRGLVKRAAKKAGLR